MNGLSLREAALEFNIPVATISGWVNDGLIRVLRKPESRGQALILLRSDVAELAAHYTPGPGRGKRAALREAIAHAS